MRTHTHTHTHAHAHTHTRTRTHTHTHTETIVGVNRYCLEEEEPVEVLSIDNTKVIATQRSKLENLYSSRDQAAVDAALHELTECAAGKGGNLLDLSIKVCVCVCVCVCGCVRV